MVGGEAASKGRRTCPSSLLQGLPGLFLQMGLLPPCHRPVRQDPYASGPLCLLVPPPGRWPQVLPLPALLASSSSKTFP